MESPGIIKPKVMRVRSNTTRKWMVAEEKALIEFLLANRDFEKPTAQHYYSRFSKEVNVEVGWKVTRSKVRYMRTTYNKAKAWEGSTGAGSMEGETIKATLLKMCTYFYELEDIFGSRICESAVIAESMECPLDTVSEELHFEQTPLPSSSNEVESCASTSRKGIYSRTAVSDILSYQTELIQLKKQKFDQEMILKEREFEIREREVTLKEKEIEFRGKDIEMKLKELNSQEKLKILELEMKERLAMEEIKLKYK